MSSSSKSNNNNTNKSVRFASSSDTNPKRKKRPRLERPNQDDDDDVDDWINDEQDNNDGVVPNERDLHDAKRSRRLKRTGQDLSDDDDDDIKVKDSSLMTDKDTEVPVEPFNMNAERTDGSGYFEGDTYVFRKRNNEDDEERDAWLESLENDEKKDSSIAKPRAVVEKKDTVDNMDDWSKEELYAKILPLVSDSETILQALVRYGDLIKRRDENSAATKLSQQALNDLTEASNALLLKGDVDIYQKTRNVLMKMMPKVQLPQVNIPVVVQWEYKGNQDGQIHGPYSTADMLGWTQAGYFIGAQAVQIRTVVAKGEAPPEKSTKDELLDDLMDDDDDDDATKEPPLVKGDWTSSNEVNFKAYG